MDPSSNAAFPEREKLWHAWSAGDGRVIRPQNVDASLGRGLLFYLVSIGNGGVPVSVTKSGIMLFNTRVWPSGDFVVLWYHGAYAIDIVSVEGLGMTDSLVSRHLSLTTLRGLQFLDHRTDPAKRLHPTDCIKTD